VAAAVTISNKACTTFTASVTGQTNLSAPQYCLYTNPAHTLVTCNSSGIFNNVPYGNYCIDIINDSTCYDTTITRCFAVNRPVPSVGASVSISNKTCTTFTASITGQTNINSASYCIYNSANALLTCNTTGVFTNLVYGTYCIKIVNDSTCYDTLITRCFTQAVPVANISLSAKKSCVSIGTSDLKVTINTGIAPYLIKLYAPTGVLLQSVTTSSSTYTFTAMPQLASPLQYKIVLTDQCGKKDSATIAPVISVANQHITVNPKCPSGIWPNGSADIVVNINDNNIGGNIIPKIIKKDGLPVNISASLVTGYAYTFLDLGPATYIFDTYIEDCNKHLFDTVEVHIYVFPILSGSNAYQCDNNGFSVSVNVLGGVGPYMYEIIGSVPAVPSIITPPQASPVFSVNNGTVYSLIRLRVTDICGNASLYDVSVLPLANFVVYSDSLECFGHTLTLRVDSLANTQYTWYKRIIPNDSVIVGTGPYLHFTNLTLADTGRYFCKIVVNNGCLIKYANYVLTGFCGILPVDITLNGAKQNDGNRLYWNNPSQEIKEYSLQRSEKNTAGFKSIGNGFALNGVVVSFTDKEPFTGNNYYRLKYTDERGNARYSNVVLIKNSKFDISVYPNPVQSSLFVSVKNTRPVNYSVEMYNMMGQKVISQVYNNIQNLLLEYPRGSISGGIYTLVITNIQTNEKETYKVVYK
jgi:hypothetical protein